MHFRREEEERRAHYVEGVTTLYARERDIAIAAYDGEAAADAIISMAEALHHDHIGARRELLSRKAMHSKNLVISVAATFT